jgi:hypothetical protein
VQATRVRLQAYQGDWLPALAVVQQVFAEAVQHSRMEMLVYYANLTARLLLEFDRFGGHHDLASAERVLQGTIRLAGSGFGATHLLPL